MKFAFEILLNGTLMGAGWGGNSLHCSSETLHLHASAWLEGYENFKYSINVLSTNLEKTGYGKPGTPTTVTFDGKIFEFRVYESPNPPTHGATTMPEERK